MIVLVVLVAIDVLDEVVDSTGGNPLATPSVEVDEMPTDVVLTLGEKKDAAGMAVKFTDKQSGGAVLKIEYNT